MRPLICCLTLSFLTLLSLLPATTLAQWHSDSLTHTPVAIAKSDQTHPQVVSDGMGGAIVVWQDHRSTYNWDIYVQRLSAKGTRLWGNGGKAICTNTSNQYSPLICSDSVGGAYIVWEDNRSSSNNGLIDLYAQHIDADGNISYDQDGIAVAKAARDQRNATMVTTTYGNAILAWEDHRESSTTLRPDIYLNVLTPWGAQHGEGGYGAVLGASGQRTPVLIADNWGGALLAWEHEHTIPTSVWASLLDSNGTLKWNPSGANTGIQIFKGEFWKNNASEISLSRDGEKFLLAWQVTNSNESDGEDIWATRVNRTGTVDWQSGVEVTGSWPGDQAKPRIFPDDSNGMIVFFEDFTSDLFPKYYNRDIAAIRVLPSGIDRIPPFADGFFHVVKQSHAQRYFQVEQDENRFVLAWDDGRNGGTDTSIYVQSIDRQFNRYLPTLQTSSLWGRVIANRSDAAHEHVAMTKREGGGFILVWADDRSGDHDIYAQLLFGNGTLPIELASFDVRSIGGDVLLDWSTANERDNAGFAIERRSLGESSYEQVSSYESNLALQGAGTSSSRKYYSYAEQPSPGSYEYRLIDVSLDGTRTTHPSKRVTVGSTDTRFVMYPNPVKDGVFILESGLRSASRIEIRDMLGKIVESRGAVEQRSTIDVHRLAPGVYAVSLFDADDRFIATERLTIVQ